MIAAQLDFRKPLIKTVPDILTPSECQEWIRRITAAGPEPAPINTGFGVEVNPRVRNNRRVMLDDPESAMQLLERVRSNAPVEIHGMKHGPLVPTSDHSRGRSSDLRNQVRSPN